MSILPRAPLLVLPRFRIHSSSLDSVELFRPTTCMFSSTRTSLFGCIRRYDLPEKLTKSKLKKLSAALLSLLVGHVDRKRVSAALFAARDIVCGAKGRIVKSAWILRRKQR
ncbi:hypothetical protein C8R45DRAFT_940880 [Mycena sanguinolenta]|nr:hypothetical protein C8R45DRAFT_940880 [Mycena sanguinolenta]